MTRNDRIAFLRKEVEYLRQASETQAMLSAKWRTFDSSLYPAALSMADEAERKSVRYAERAQVLEETLDEYDELVMGGEELG